MATSEQIRNRIVELVKSNEFDKLDLLQVFSQLVHEGFFENNDIIEIVKYLMNDILNVQTKMSYGKSKRKCYNSHQFAKGERFEIKGIEFIVDNN